MPTVNYNGKIVSDSNVKAVLQKIADELKNDLNVTSGDRSSVVKGSSKKSHHIQKRAADFHVKSMSDESALKKIKENKSTIFDSDKKYQVIIHGNFTNTGGPHLHIGRYSTGNGVSFLQEGMNKDSKGKYTVAMGFFAPPSMETSADIARLSNLGLAEDDVC